MFRSDYHPWSEKLWMPWSLVLRVFLWQTARNRQESPGLQRLPLQFQMCLCAEALRRQVSNLLVVGSDFHVQAIRLLGESREDPIFWLIWGKKRWNTIASSTLLVHQNLNDILVARMMITWRITVYNRVWPIWLIPLCKIHQNISKYYHTTKNSFNRILIQLFLRLHMRACRRWETSKLTPSRTTGRCLWTPGNRNCWTKSSQILCPDTKNLNFDIETKKTRWSNFLAIRQEPLKSLLWSNSKEARLLCCTVLSVLQQLDTSWISIATPTDFWGTCQTRHPSQTSAPNIRCSCQWCFKW